MVIVELSGGLGNQMFQYALYLKLKSLGKDVEIDTSLCNSQDASRYQKLADAFGIELEPIPVKEANRIRGFAVGGSKVVNLFYRLTKSKKITIYEDKIDDYQDCIFELDDVLLSGYWQSEQYFASIKDEIKKAFTFHYISDENQKLAQKMCDENSVSIHIRRTDYLNDTNRLIYGDICTENYYENAIKYMRSHLDSPIFYVFSDDVEWIKNSSIITDDMIIVENNNYDKSYQDMFLISSCKNNVIANSTFSWWGAYLKTNVGLVVCPSRWLNNHDVIDNIVCANWVRI